MPDKIEKHAVVIQGPATDMLLQHARFAAQVSEMAAKRLIKEFKVKAKTLEIMPHRCPWLHSTTLPDHKYRKLLFEKHYLLIFQIIDGTVYVDAMVDCRQDYDWLLTT